MFQKWVDAGLSKPGKTNAELAELLGLAASRVSEMRRGLRRIHIHELPIIARYIEEPPPLVAEQQSAPLQSVPYQPAPAVKKKAFGWLTKAKEAAATTSTGTITVPLIAWVSAGKMSFPDISDEIKGHVEEGGLDPEGDWIALQVVGDSMDRISPPESIIFVDRSDKVLVPNACYVISTSDGEATYKRFRPNPMRFEPVSTNPTHEPIYPTREPLVVGRVGKTILRM